MALDPKRGGREPSLSDEEAMANYYSMENDHAQREEERADGIYRPHIGNPPRGYHRVDSRQSACKCPQSLPRCACLLHVVECKVKFVKWALGP